MRITSFAKEEITCYIDGEHRRLRAQDSIIINDDFETLSLIPTKESCSKPTEFRKVKNIHLATDFSISKADLLEYTHLKVFIKEQKAIDIETDIYYDYLYVYSDDDKVNPTDCRVTAKDIIHKEFIEINKKDVKRKAVFNVFSQPRIPRRETIDGLLGLLLIYFFSAFFLVMFDVPVPLICIIIGVALIPLVVIKTCLYKKELKKHFVYKQKFEKLLTTENIFRYCYEYDVFEDSQPTKVKLNNMSDFKFKKDKYDK